MTTRDYVFFIGILVALIGSLTQAVIGPRDTSYVWNLGFLIYLMVADVIISRPRRAPKYKRHPMWDRYLD